MREFGSRIHHVHARHGQTVVLPIGWWSEEIEGTPRIPRALRELEPAAGGEPWPGGRRPSHGRSAVLGAEGLHPMGPRASAGRWRWFGEGWGVRGRGRGWG